MAQQKSGMSSCIKIYLYEKYRMDRDNTASLSYLVRPLNWPVQLIHLFESASHYCRHAGREVSFIPSVLTTLPASSSLLLITNTAVSVCAGLQPQPQNAAS